MPVSPLACLASQSIDKDGKVSSIVIADLEDVVAPNTKMLSTTSTTLYLGSMKILLSDVFWPPPSVKDS